MHKLSKKLIVIFSLLFMIFCFPVFSEVYISIGLDLNLDINCDEEVIDKNGYVFPRPGIYLGFDGFKASTTGKKNAVGFHIDCNGIFTNSDETLGLGLSSQIGPGFLLETNKEQCLIFSPVVSLGFILSFSNDNQDERKSSYGSAFAGFGCNVLYCFRSGFSFGGNFFYYPFMSIDKSETQYDIETTFSKVENCFSIGIMICFTDWVK